MARTPSSDTPELLSSLSRSEKRYVRMHLERLAERRQPAWLELFDQLSADPPPPTDQLLERCPSIADTKALSNAKASLRDRVLDALRDYYADAFPENQLLRRIADIEILIRKERFQLADKLLRSTWKITKRMGWSWYWPKLAQLSAYLARNATKIEDIFDEVTAIESEIDYKMAEAEEALRLNLLATRLFGWLRRRGGYAVEEQNRELQAISEDPLLQIPPPDDHLESLMRYHEIWGTIEFHQRHYGRSLEHRQRLVEIFSADPRRISEEPRRFIALMNNLIISAMRLDDYEEVSRWISRLRNFPDQYKLRNRENVEAHVFSKTYSIELYYLLSRKMYSELQDVIRGMRPGLKKFESRLTLVNKIDFSYLLARTAFEREDYNLCLDELRPLLYDYDTGWRTDIHVFGRILNLLTHYELGNYRVVESGITSFRRFIKQVGHRDKLTQSLMRLLSKINFQDDRKVVQSAISRFQTDLEKQGLEGRQRVFLTETGLDAWMKRRLAVHRHRRA